MDGNSSRVKRHHLRAVLGILCLFASAVSALSGQELWPDLSTSAKSRGGGQKDAAVVIGAENYTFVEHIPGARKNADDWQKYLTETLGVPSYRVKLLRDNEATLERMRKYVSEATSEVEPGGTLWFIFIGHGAPSKDGKDGLLVGTDAQQDIDSLYARSFARSELLNILARGHQVKTVVVLDACFSGRASSGQALISGLQPLMVMRGLPSGIDNRTILLTAASSDQFAGPLPKTKVLRPAFSYLALGALRGWAADARGRVTASALINFARRALALEKGRTQTPELAAGAPEAVLGVGREPPPDLAKIDREERMSDGKKSSAISASEPQRIHHVGGNNDNFSALGRVPVHWVSIPGGNFMMSNTMVHEKTYRVNVKTFQMAKTPITFGQYNECVQVGACTPPHVADGKCSIFKSSTEGYINDSHLLPKSFQGDTQPVVCVDWDQASEFSKWIGGRLPSEAEWEYAARSAGKYWKFPWGNDGPTCERAVFSFGAPGCGKHSTWPVCSKPKGNTEQGLCDMVGNVAEWTQDWDHNFSHAGAPTDGSAWESPTGKYRIARGVSWSDDLSLYGMPHAPNVADDLGFRPVR